MAETQAHDHGAGTQDPRRAPGRAGNCRRGYKKTGPTWLTTPRPRSRAGTQDPRRAPGRAGNGRRGCQKWRRQLQRLPHRAARGRGVDRRPPPRGLRGGQPCLREPWCTDRGPRSHCQHESTERHTHRVNRGSATTCPRGSATTGPRLSDDRPGSHEAKRTYTLHQESLKRAQAQVIHVDRLRGAAAAAQQHPPLRAAEGVQGRFARMCAHVERNHNLLTAALSHVHEDVRMERTVRYRPC